jgi:hypothetical protein
MSKRRARFYRGHRIVLLQLGTMWHGIVYAPRGSAIVEKDIQAETELDAMARAMRLVEARLAQPRRLKRSA